MAMSRDEILQRMVTGAAHIESGNLTKAQLEKYWFRYNELEADLNRLKEEEKKVQPPPEQVQTEMDKIRGMLEPEKGRSK